MAWTPFGDTATYARQQLNIPHKRVANWVFNRRDFISALNDLGYRLVFCVDHDLPITHKNAPAPSVMASMVSRERRRSNKARSAPIQNCARDLMRYEAPRPRRRRLVDTDIDRAKKRRARPKACDCRVRVRRGTVSYRVDHQKKISILCPVFNEEAAVPLFYQRLKPVLSSLSRNYQVDLVFLDNASDDGTYRQILDIRKDWPSTYVIVQSRNVGYQRSLAAGLQRVTGDLFAFIDVDCEDPPEMISEFVALHETGGYDIVYRPKKSPPR